ncbi:TolC family protein [Flavihumibacter stibioxidans]|uniref:Outer membrane protein TolC n=1 Tax=Flavihumibacter stibioxidans TaxID=1834163 RepID=A0ABR7MBD2_9BACT|nr:TolC family protein [Flavihumibacter stibioxidans]MBC6492350.1 hypothetical protein [Flavihumibacter stibioxidans]
MKKHAFILPLLCLAVFNGNAQTLTLEECQQLARKNYPLTRQYELIDHTSAYSLENAGKSWLPQIAINGQATYQSDVIHFPKTAQGPVFPTLSKDQYRISGELTQLLYDGGNTRLNRSTTEAQSGLEKARLEEKLYQLNNRINNLYFGILLLNQQIIQNQLLQGDIKSGIKRTEAALQHGTVFRSQLNELRANLLLAQQMQTELLTARRNWLDILSAFTGQTLDENTVLPEPPIPGRNNTISRPELAVFEQSRKLNELRQQAISVKSRPRISAFFQGSWGRPTFDIVSNEFGVFWIGGLRFSWNLGHLYTNRNDKKLIETDQKLIDLQKETFLFNTSLDTRLEEGEITKYLKLMETDEEIVLLRNEVKKAAAAQLENGVITPHDFLIQVHAEDQAKQQYLLHKVSLLRAHYNLSYQSGK